MFELPPEPPGRSYAAIAFLSLAAIICLLGFAEIGVFGFIFMPSGDLGHTIGGMLLLLLSVPFLAAGLWLDHRQPNSQTTAAPASSLRLALPKVIAIVAVLGILSFGLCTAGLVARPTEATSWTRAMRWFLPACGFSAMICLPVVILLALVRTIRGHPSGDQ